VSTETPTPRTDAEVRRLLKGWGLPEKFEEMGNYPPWSFARQLERELAAVEKEREGLHRAWSRAVNITADQETQLTAANARIAELDSKLAGMERAHGAAMSVVRVLERDKARLDWIEENADQIHCSECVAGNVEQYWIAPTRAAIDAAMTPPPNTIPHA